VKKTAGKDEEGDDISAIKADSSSSITTALISPRRGRSASRGAPEKPDALIRNESDASAGEAAPSRKRSNSRVRSLFALGANKIERGEIVSVVDERPTTTTFAIETEEASPFPGIRLHQNHEAEETSGPFPGVRLRTCTDASEDQAAHSAEGATTAGRSVDAEPAETVTTLSTGRRRRADTASDKTDSSKVLDAQMVASFS
jgi:hypothetical protein